MKIVIDETSGFCFGVVKAITTAEEELRTHSKLYCLGDIVHNGQEVARLSAMGLITIDHNQLSEIKDGTVLLRAHGEPPSTYAMAHKNNMTIIDASCPVVLRLQQKIKEAYIKYPEAQIVIYGKIGHAEVIGLEGQTENNAIVIESEKDLHKIDLNRTIILFSQTTKSISEFNAIVDYISKSKPSETTFKYYDTICRQVANRLPNIKIFAEQFDLILFVSGQKSSNGKVLFNECKKVNPNSHLISATEQIEPEWIKGIESVGICGATSTPKWLMEEVETYIRNI
ncbi:MAG: 4-hydroxy-3-methylbut-2-enyl diphosphate reductase [bacterium]